MKEDSSRIEEENRKLTATLLDSENARKSRQDLLDNISDFDACVYRQQNLPQGFASKIQTWVTINKDKVDRARDRWECDDRGEEVSTSEG